MEDPLRTPIIPAGVCWVRDGDGPVAVGWAADPARRLAASRRDRGRELSLLAVADGDRGTAERIAERLSGARERPGWFRPRRALAELKRQWQAGRLLWLAGCAATPLELALGNEPHGAPWIVRRDRQTAERGVGRGLTDAEQRVVALILPVISAVAAEHRAIRVDRAAVERVVQTLPDRPHADAAAAWEHWALHGNGARRQRRIQDAVASFRNWLARTDPVQIAGGPRATEDGATVTSLRSEREARDQRRLDQARRAAAARSGA